MFQGQLEVEEPSLAKARGCHEKNIALLFRLDMVRQRTIHLSCSGFWQDALIDHWHIHLSGAEPATATVLRNGLCHPCAIARNACSEIL